MPPRINVTEEMKEEVRQLLREGFTTRQIEARTGIGRSTVSTIGKSIKGELLAIKRNKRKAKKKEKQKEKLLPKAINPYSQELIHSEFPREDYRRCPGCGALVLKQYPCLACNQKRVLSQDFDCYFNELTRTVDNTAYPMNIVPRPHVNVRNK